MVSYIESDEKWKINKDTFSEPFSDPGVMIKKIKKIRKNKKQKNYKNIELFDDIHEVPAVIEGLSEDGIAHFKESDYVGGQDDIYEGGNEEENSHSTGNGLVDFIESIFKMPDKITYPIAYKITKLFSNKKEFHHNDVYVIKKYVGWFFSILISCYVVYNWAFIMIYTDETTGKTTELSDFLTRDNFDTQSLWNPVYRLANYFLQFPLFFPEKLQQGIQYTSYFAPKIFDPSVCFTLLFFFIIFVFYHSLDVIKDLFIAIAKFDITNILLLCIQGIIVFLLALAFVKPDWNPFKAVAKINPIFTTGLMISTIIEYSFAFFVGPAIAAIFCIMYLFVYSFFGIILQTGFDFKTAYRTFSKINEYCRKTKNEIRKETPCDPYGFFERIMIYINVGLDFMYKYCFQIAFIYLLLYGMFDYNFISNLRASSLKSSLTIINLIVSISLVMSCYSSYDVKLEGEDKVSDALPSNKMDSPETAPIEKPEIPESTDNK